MNINDALLPLITHLKLTMIIDDVAIINHQIKVKINSFN